MHHLLLTEFALPFPDSPRPRYTNYLDNNPNWLEERLDLFEKYTLPSVKAQTETSFRWLLLCNRSHPHMTSAIIRRLANYSPDAEVFWVDTVNFSGQYQHWPELAAAIAPQLHHDWVVTTRLDSDDMVRRNFIERIQESAIKEEPLGFQMGYMLEGDTLYPRSYLRGPFISWVERSANFKSVFHKPHTRYRGIRDICQDEPSWIQVVHGGNLMNAIGRAGLKSEDGIPLTLEIAEEFGYARYS